MTENNVPIMIASDYNDLPYNNQTAPPSHVYPSTEDIIKSTEAPCEPGHSRNSSNTSQLSKASGYSSIHSHSHSRQSSSGDSGHIRYVLKSLTFNLVGLTVIFAKIRIELKINNIFFSFCVYFLYERVKSIKKCYFVWNKL